MSISISCTLLLIAAPLLGGCGSTKFSEQQALSLRSGFTMEEVVAVLGEPSSRQSGSEMDGERLLEEFGNALAREQPERLDHWHYVDVDFYPGDAVGGYDFRVLDLHFLDRLLLRNETLVGPELLRQVRNGMSIQGVIDILGRPLMKTRGAWVFYGEQGGVMKFPIEFSDAGIVEGWPVEVDGEWVSG